MILKIPERGHLEIDADSFSRLSQAPSFWKLVDAKLLGISHIGPGRVRLDGHSFVGRAVLPDTILEIEEKIPGALASLLSSATHEAFKLEKIKSMASELGDLAALLITTFLTELKTYVSKGRETIYTCRSFTGSLIGGRINLTRSIKLRSRGLRHMVSFEKHTLSRNTQKNRLFLAALQEIQDIAEIVHLEESQVAKARELAMIFEDCRDFEVLFARRALAEHAEVLLAQTTTDRDLIALAGVILANASFEYQKPILGSVPGTWFLNLEVLFEKAIRDAIRRGLPSVVVRKGTEQPRAIFVADATLYKANPDLVLAHLDRVCGVGDVKYKSWSGMANADDIYQLLVHTAAFGATKAFLIYPHDCFECVYLGASSTGSSVWLFAVDVRNLDHSIRLCAERLQLVPLATVA
jgi:5-methylcytosine-specific restriction endonuclease McrBC regulatory subunit McrC